MSSHDDIQRVALAEFASAGYAGTSLQRIAELAGVAKSSILYHYASKEALLEAAVGPAIDDMSAILDSLQGAPLTADRRAEFLAKFVDLLLTHRLEVHMFINQGPSLVDVPVIDRANELVLRLAQFFAINSTSLEERMRFGIALGGAAYMLCTADTMGIEMAPADETRVALVAIMSELLAPVGAVTSGASTQE